MKKRKILVLFPVLGLLLSGCTFQEGLETAKSFFGDKIIDPIKNLINGGGDKEEEKGEEEKPTPTPTPTVKTVVKILLVNAPRSIEQGKTLSEKDVTLDVKYSDNTAGTVQATKVELVTSTVGEAEGTAYYNELSEKFTINVTEPVVSGTFTPEEIIAKCDEAGSGKVVEGLLRVRGEVALGASKESNGWSGKFVASGEKELTFDSVRSEVEYDSLEGKVITIEGYAELYNGTYKVGYLPATASPTGAKYNPSLVKVEDAPQKTVTAIISVEGPAKVYQNSELEVGDFIVNVQYSDGTSGQVRPDAIVSYDTSALGESTVVIKVGEHTAECTINVVEQPAGPVHAGTLEDPYTISDAYLLFEQLEPRKITEECYVTGVIAAEPAPTVEGGRGRFYLSDGICETDLYVYNINNKGGKNDLELEAIPAGAVVVAKGGIKKYVSGDSEIFEFCYNKENPAVACELISVVTEIVHVTGVELDKEALPMDLGDPDVQLNVSFSPENATNKAVTWDSSNEEVATVSNGLVHAVGAGEATITVTSVDNPEAKDTLVVTVSETEKQLLSVAVTAMPKTVYTEGELLDLTGMEVTLTYDQGEPIVITSGYETNIALDHKLTSEDTSLVVSFGGVEAEPIALTINEKAQPTHAGTLEDPYSVSDAKILFDDLAEGEITGECYVTGTIAAEPAPALSGNTNARGRFYLTDGVCSTDLYVYNIDKIGGGTGVTLDDIPVGAVVVAKGGIKNYGGTFELCYNKENPAVACELISVEKPTVLVTGITLSTEEENMLVGYADLTLTATVAPENASNKELIWVSSNEEVATVENGVVHAVAEGDAVITARAKDGSGIEATCTVHVSVPLVEVVEVVVSVTPKVEYTEGDLLDLSEMELTVTKSDQSVEEHVTTGYSTNIALDHELTKEDTSLVVTYGGVEAEPIALTINEKAKPTHAGTLEDPYTVSDAKILFDDLAEGEITGECYVTGTIAAEPAPALSGNSNARGRFYLTDGVCPTDLYVYNIDKIGGGTGVTLEDIPVGAVVVAKGGIKNYGGTFELCYNKENPAVACELISVEKPVIEPTTVTIDGAASVQEGKTTALTATVGPVGAPNDVVWTSNNEQVATVNENGVVTGVSQGTAVITATAANHETVFGTHEITVTPKPSEPTETDVYTLTPASGSNNGYAGNCDIEINGITWNLTGNSTMQPWRLGGKNLSGVDRELYSKTAISDNITKIEVEHGGAANITVNSATLIVSKNDDFSEPVSTVSFEFAANAKTTIERPEDADWSSCYYKFVYNLTVSGNSNKFIEFTGAVFYAVV